MASDCSVFDRLISSIDRALGKRILPRRRSLGTSGLYQLRDSARNVVALFKPIDEEPALADSAMRQELKPGRNVLRKFSNDQVARTQCKAKSSFRGNAKQVSLRKGIYSGELAQREVFAYLLDGKGVHGVPPTTLVEIDGSCFAQGAEGPKAPKLGALQKYQ